MRITYICYEDLSEHRGGVAHVLGVVRQLRRQGHEVRLIVPAVQGGVYPALHGINVVYLPILRVRILNWIGFYIVSTLYLLVIALTGRPDVIYSREMVYNIWLPLGAKLIHTPHVIEINGLIRDERAALGAHGFELALLAFVQRLSLKWADAIIAVTEGIRKALITDYDLPRDKVHVVANGTDPGLFYPRDETACRMTLQLPLTIPIIGFVGSCYAYHDIPTLICAAPRVLNRYPETLFMIVGDGAMRLAWMEQVEQAGLSSSFCFTGRISYGRVPDYINAFTICMAVFVKVEHQKIGSPMKLYDYLACGKAVVGSGIEEIYEILHDGQGGLAVPPEDPKALAEAIVRLLDDPVARETMGKQGRRFVLAHNTWGHTAARIIELCRTARNETRGG